MRRLGGKIGYQLVRTGSASGPVHLKAGRHCAWLFTETPRISAPLATSKMNTGAGVSALRSVTIMPTLSYSSVSAVWGSCPSASIYQATSGLLPNSASCQSQDSEPIFSNVGHVSVTESYSTTKALVSDARPSATSAFKRARYSGSSSVMAMAVRTSEKTKGTPRVSATSIRPA